MSPVTRVVRLIKDPFRLEIRRVGLKSQWISKSSTHVLILFFLNSKHEPFAPCKVNIYRRRRIRIRCEIVTCAEHVSAIRTRDSHDPLHEESATCPLKPRTDCPFVLAFRPSPEAEGFVDSFPAIPWALVIDAAEYFRGSGHIAKREPADSCSMLLRALSSCCEMQSEACKAHVCNLRHDNAPRIMA